jgi:molybdopterin-guanine dinucleotide biosynthesis protein B
MSSMRTPVAFIGYSGSGKTTFLISLVAMLSTRGERVAVIKHTHHEPSTRKPRGDTERFLEAGAVRAVLAGRNEAIVMERSGTAVLRHFRSAAEIPGWLDADRVLVEGFKSLELCPRILVERGDVERIRPVPSVVAVITDVSEAFDVPRFAHDDLDGIRTFLDRITTG